MPPLLPAMALLLGCGTDGDWSAYEPDPAALPDNTVEQGSYPAGPYGTREGDAMENIAFAQAFFDPDTWCKRAEDFDLGTARGIQQLSLGDQHRGDQLCGKRKQFLWLISAAGW